MLDDTLIGLFHAQTTPMNNEAISDQPNLRRAQVIYPTIE